jgi:3-phenylpropionate/cinnamic acid dioxygenase small subunit
MIADHLELTNQLGRFARTLDQRNWEAVPSIFAAEISFDYGEGKQQGLPALLAQFRKYLDYCGPSQHLLGSIEVQIEGATALTRSYVQARHQGAAGRQDRCFDSHGVYVDQWRKNAAGWLIVQRDVRWLMHRGDPGVLVFAPA